MPIIDITVPEGAMDAKTKVEAHTPHLISWSVGRYARSASRYSRFSRSWSVQPSGRHGVRRFSRASSSEVALPKCCTVSASPFLRNCHVLSLGSAITSPSGQGGRLGTVRASPRVLSPSARPRTPQMGSQGTLRRSGARASTRPARGRRQAQWVTLCMLLLFGSMSLFHEST